MIGKPGNPAYGYTVNGRYADGIGESMPNDRRIKAALEKLDNGKLRFYIGDEALSKLNDTDLSVAGECIGEILSLEIWQYQRGRKK